MPGGAKVVVFADDIAVVVVAKHLAQVVKICNQAIRSTSISAWMLSVGLELAVQKAKAVLISCRKVGRLLS